jgi:hypothetical protein
MQIVNGKSAIVMTCFDNVVSAHAATSDLIRTDAERRARGLFRQQLAAALDCSRRAGGCSAERNLGRKGSGAV